MIWRLKINNLFDNAFIEESGGQMQHQSDPLKLFAQLRLDHLRQDAELVVVLLGPVPHIFSRGVGMLLYQCKYLRSGHSSHVLLYLLSSHSR
jgi:hypothetical protein